MVKFMLAGVVALGIVGCNSEDSSDLKRDAGKLAQTAGNAAENAQLVIRVNAQLAQTKGVEVEGLHVEAKDGTVSVSGHVHSAAEKETIRKAVAGIKGVEKVVVDKLNIATH